MTGMDQKNTFLGLFCGSFAALMSVSWFVLGEASSKGFRIYGGQARVAACGMFILVLFGMWLNWGKFVIKESLSSFILVIAELTLGALVMAYLAFRDSYFDKDFELAIVMAVVVVLTDYLLRKARVFWGRS